MSFNTFDILVGAYATKQVIDKNKLIQEIIDMINIEQTRLLENPDHFIFIIEFKKGSKVIINYYDYEQVKDVSNKKLKPIASVEYKVFLKSNDSIFALFEILYNLKFNTFDHYDFEKVKLLKENFEK
ncbi:hypothetical protein [Spiroplasma endosymbiont of Amphibalanus improvisus]|uniref:hypothetical protein n=1 Tax=Spiroplasma endosymbiont of Amphibalanus improvisus TaxID=3066327 RepID=UPI00313B7287